MATKITEFDFKRITFEKSLAELSRRIAVNISIDWKALVASKIAGDTMLELHLRNVTMSEVLEAILRGAARVDERLDYLPRDGVIIVTTEKALADQLLVRAYPCRDLLKGSLSPEQERHLDGAVARLWKEHYAVFGPPWRRLPSQREGRPYLGTRRETVDILAELQASLSARRIGQIVEAIYATVDSSSWRQSGATIRTVGDSLVISQTVRNHRAIAELLSQLRTASK